MIDYSCTPYNIHTDGRFYYDAKPKPKKERHNGKKPATFADYKYKDSIPLNDIEVVCFNVDPNRYSPSVLEHLFLQGYRKEFNGDLPLVNRAL